MIKLRLYLSVIIISIFCVILFTIISREPSNKLNKNYCINCTTEQTEDVKRNAKLRSIEFYKILENVTIKEIPIKYMLLWTKYFSWDNWIDRKINFFGPEFFKEIGCPETNCILTSNRSLLTNVYEFDAIFFHPIEIRNIENPYPKLRSSHQKYIMGYLEPPSTFPKALMLDNYFYNWTMSYKLNSDAIWPYAIIQDKETNEIITPSKNPYWRSVENVYDKDILSLIKNKSKIAAQFVSHCNTASNRETLTRILQKYLEVDVYGRCGPLKCQRFKKPCDDMLDTVYKFYFSFENDLCEDYVTEKLFNALERMIVPVVYGGADYNRWAPPKSYINANDFKNVKELAKYLIYLDEHPEEYIKYFWWKKYYEVKNIRGHGFGFCNVCLKLHNPNIINKIEYYSDIRKWFTETCHRKKQISFVV